MLPPLPPSHFEPESSTVPAGSQRVPEQVRALADFPCARSAMAWRVEFGVGRGVLIWTTMWVCIVCAACAVAAIAELALTAVTQSTAAAAATALTNPRRSHRG